MLEKILYRVVVIIPLFIIGNCDAPWVHNRIDAYLTLHLTIKNSMETGIVVAYSPTGGFSYDGSSYSRGTATIQFPGAPISIESKKGIEDTIRYKFNCANYCYLDKYVIKDFPLDVVIKVADTIYKTITVFPVDTLIKGEKLDDCIKLYWDTLEIK